MSVSSSESVDERSGKNLENVRLELGPDLPITDVTQNT